MAERDLSGFDDCDEQFSEIDTATAEHMRHSAYWAISTRRGQDWEEPGRWLELRDALEQRGIAGAQGGAQNVSTDLEETDPRVLRAEYRVTPGEVTRWSATIATRAGTVTAEGPLQPLTSPDESEEDVAPGVSTQQVAPSLRQVAVDGGLFPHWLLGPNNGRVIYSIGLLLDMATEWLTIGIQQRFPLVCDEGALPWIARDRGIRRGFRESADSFRRRLARWIPTWKRAGNVFAIAEQIQAYCWPQVPRVHVVQHDPGGATRATWNTRHPDGSETVVVVTASNWDFDSTHPLRPAGLATRDPRLWVLIEQTEPADPQTLFVARTSAQAATRDLLGMNGCVRPDGSRAPADQYADLLDIAQTFRASGSYIAGIFAVLDYPVDPEGSGAEFPDGSWWDPVNDARDGNRISTRFRLLYLDEFPSNRIQEP